MQGGGATISHQQFSALQQISFKTCAANNGALCLRTIEHRRNGKGCLPSLHAACRLKALRGITQAPQAEAARMLASRFPLARLVDCDQNGSQARFIS